MNDPQIWTLIGVFAAVMFGIVGLISTWWTRMVRSQFEAMGYRFDALESKLAGRIDAVEAKLATRIDAVEAKLATKIEHLDKDIGLIFRRVFPEES